MNPGAQSTGSVVAITRSSIAADAVTTLNVEPGSYRSWTARLRRATTSAPLKTFGLKVG